MEEEPQVIQQHQQHVFQFFRLTPAELPQGGHVFQCRQFGGLRRYIGFKGV